MVCGAAGWSMSAMVVPGLTNNPDFAAASCAAVAANPMAPLGNGMYLVRRNGGTFPTVCSVAIAESGDRAGTTLGGDGSTEANAAQSCDVLMEIVGEDNFDTDVEYWIDDDADMSTAGSTQMFCKTGFWGSKQPMGDVSDGQVDGVVN